MKKNRKKRQMWVKPWLQKKLYGTHSQIFTELQHGEIKDMQDYIRLSPEMFNTLLEKVRTHISRTDTNMRDSISAGARLEATLRYLATGATYGSLQYMSRISKSTLSSIIPDTCDAIYKALKNDYVKVSLSVVSMCIPTATVSHIREYLQ